MQRGKTSGKTRKAVTLQVVAWMIGFTSAAVAAIVVNMAAMQGVILPPNGYLRIYPPNVTNGGYWSPIDVTPTLAAQYNVKIESTGYKRYVIGKHQKWLDGNDDPLKIIADFYRLKVTETPPGAEKKVAYVDVPPATYIALDGEVEDYRELSGHEEIPPPKYALEDGKVFVFETVSDGGDGSPILIKWKLVNSFRIK